MSLLIEIQLVVALVGDCLHNAACTTNDVDDCARERGYFKAARHYHFYRSDRDGTAWLKTLIPYLGT